MSYRRFAASCAALVVAFLTACACAAATDKNGTQTWLVVSDIHLDPFNRWSEPSLPGRDTNLALFDSALAQMKRDVPNPSLVLIPGDFFVHDFPSVVRRHDAGTSPYTAGLDIMRLIESAFNRAYPQARFAIALGNNDAPCGDYRADIDDPYLTAVARVWAPLIRRGGAATDFVPAFSHGGYYATTLPIRGFRLIVLNTILFSSKFKGSCAPGTGNAARAELRWASATLGATPPRMQNIVMMHIPPGYDAFSTQMTKGFVPWAFLNAGDNNAIIALLTAAPNRVKYALAGHTHRFDFRLIGNVPMIIFGSVSPIYRSNPSFYSVRLGEDGSLKDIDVYAYDEWNGEWSNGRSFDRAWGVDRIDAATLERIHERLARDPAMRRNWDLASNGWPSNPAIAWPMWQKLWRASWCAQTVLQAGYAQCAGIEPRVTLGRLFLGIAAVCGAAALTFLTWRGIRAFALMRR
jgi:Calcineurin-like phosphoesterase